MAASMAPPQKYADDAARIDREYVPDSATTEAEVRQALSDAGFPAASQSHIQDWLVSEEDAWDVVGPSTQDARSVQQAIDRASNGTISQGRARSMAENIGSAIQSARAEAAQRVSDNGQIRTPSGGFGPKLQNAEEVVRQDGIYYRAQDTGREFLGARIER